MTVQIEQVAEQAERLLTATDVTIIGIMLVVILLLLIAVWQFWKINKELNAEIRGFIEKYYVLSTKILSFLSKGKDV